MSHTEVNEKNVSKRACSSKQTSTLIQKDRSLQARVSRGHGGFRPLVERTTHPRRRVPRARCDLIHQPS